MIRGANHVLADWSTVKQLTVAALPTDKDAAMRGKELMKRAFGHRFSYIGVLRALLEMLAHPVVLFALADKSEPMQDLANPKWSALSDQKRERSLDHINKILAFVRAAVFDHQSLAKLIETINAAHAGKTFELKERVGAWPPAIYKIDETEYLFWVLATIMRHTLEAYNTFVVEPTVDMGLTDDDRDDFYTAMLNFAAPLGINLHKVNVTPVTEHAMTAGIEKWLSQMSDYLSVTDEARTIVNNLVASGFVQSLICPKGYEFDVITLIAEDLTPHVRGGTTLHKRPEGNYTHVEGYGINVVNSHYESAVTTLRTLLDHTDPKGLQAPFTS